MKEQKEQRKKERKDGKKTDKKKERKEKIVGPGLEFDDVHGITRTEEHTDTFTPVCKTSSDEDEISLLFEDAMEYQDEDIDDILAELASVNDTDEEGTLKGAQGSRKKKPKKQTVEWGVFCC